MPFKSLKQEGYMHEHPEILGKAGLADWDAATKGKHLPEKAHMKSYATAGLGHEKPKAKKKEKTHRPKHTHVEHHDDGSHTFRHTMDDGKDVTGTAPNDAALGDHMQEMLGAPAQDEGAPQMGASAAPPAA
jgi:hypothetical protein